MKTKNSLLLAVLLSFAAACTETELVKPEEKPGIVTRPDQREVLLAFENKLVMPTSPQADTRATVEGTTAENKLEAFDVYVFGSETEEGTYTFQEKLALADLELKPIDADKGTYAAVLRPTKGLFVKLYCVGNTEQLYTLADDGTTFAPCTAFTPLKQKEGKVTEAGAPPEADFKTFTTAPIGSDGVFAGALPMTGAVTAPLDLTDLSATSRLNVGLKLTRGVARFDVVNNATASKFIITSIGLSNGRPAAQLFPLSGVGVVQACAPRIFSDGPTPPATLPTLKSLNENGGTSAFYSYPSATSNTGAALDDGALILTGTYRMNLTTTVDVTYRIPFDQVRDGNGLQVHINPNHRYVVKITDADPTEVKFTFTVADWNEDDSLNEFDPANTLIAVKEVVGDGIFVDDANTFLIDPTAGKKLDSQVESSSRIVKSEVTYTGQGTRDWVTATLSNPATRGGGVFTPLEITVNALPDLSDVATATLKLTNELGIAKTFTITYPGIRTAEEMYSFKDLVIEYPKVSGDRQLEVERKLRKYATKGNNNKWSSVLLSDIDMNKNSEFDLTTGEITGATPADWPPFPIDSFDGKGHTISKVKGLRGLFMTANGTVKNLNVTGIMNSPNNPIGSICSLLLSGAKIINCTANVYIDSTMGAGGICYVAEASTEIRNCATKGIIKTTEGAVGGICSGIAGNIIACKNEAPLTATEPNSFVGGIAARSNERFSIIACYNTGVFSGPAGRVFGITDKALTKQCYTTITTAPPLETDFGVATDCFFIASTPHFEGFTAFGADNAWPGKPGHDVWKIGNGTADAYWKSLGSWNNGTPVYPKLHWEK